MNKLFGFLLALMLMFLFTGVATASGGHDGGFSPHDVSAMVADAGPIGAGGLSFGTEPADVVKGSSSAPALVLAMPLDYRKTGNCMAGCQSEDPADVFYLPDILG